jgi:hypothetical protein
MIKKYGALLAAANIITALFLVREVSLRLRSNTLTQTTINEKRFRGVVNSMPQILEHSDTKTLFIGTSIFHYFLRPDAFDESMANHGVKTTSYNMGFGGLMGPSYLALVNRLFDEAKGNRFRAVVFEFSPVSLSRQFYESYKTELDLDFPAIFLSGPSLWRFAQRDPPSASWMLLNQTLQPFDWGKFGLFYRFIWGRERYQVGRMAGAPGLFQLPEYYEVPEWNATVNGRYDWNLARSASSFEQDVAEIHEPSQWRNMIQKYVTGHSLNSRFKMDRGMLDATIQSVRVAKELATQRVVVILPYAPSFQILADKFVDYPGTISKIERETGVEVIDLRNVIPLTDEDFVDAMHPKFETMNKLMAIVAARSVEK